MPVDRSGRRVAGLKFSWWNPFLLVPLLMLITPLYIDLQLIGGVITLQTLPAVAIALYTRWFHRIGLIAGWVVGMTWGLIMLYNIPNEDGTGHLGGSALSLGKLSIFGWHPFGSVSMPIYAGFIALIANILVAVVVTAIVRRMKLPDGTDATEDTDYHTDEGDESLRPIASA